MKKFAIVFVMAFLVALLASSCNREICPAYTNANQVSTDHIG